MGKWFLSVVLASVSCLSSSIYASSLIGCHFKKDCEGVPACYKQALTEAKKYNTYPTEYCDVISGNRGVMSRCESGALNHHLKPCGPWK